MVQHHHTCGRASPELAREGPITLAAYGTSAVAAPGSLGAQKHNRGTTSAEPFGQEATMRDLSTPLASAGAGDVGAECDATPLQSRPQRGASRSQGSFTLASLLGGAGAGAETASEEATSASGVESPGNGEGRGVLKRKDTITWESFLANMSVSDGAKEDGRAKGAASASDSSSPVEIRLPREASSEGPAAAVSFSVCSVCVCHALDICVNLFFFSTISKFHLLPPGRGSLCFLFFLFKCWWSLFLFSCLDVLIPISAGMGFILLDTKVFTPDLAASRLSRRLVKEVKFLLISCTLLNHTEHMLVLLNRGR